MRHALFLMTILVVICFTGCKEEDKKVVARGLPLSSIYLDYQVWGEEEKEYVTVLIRLFENSNFKKPVALPAPGFVELDGQVLIADSSEMAGHFYEIQFHVDDFEGPHKIIVADAWGKQATEEFEFSSFALKEEIPDLVTKRDDFTLPILGLKDGEFVRVIMIDTVFSTSDINRLDTLRNNEIVIERQALQDVASGPVSLLLFKEEEEQVYASELYGGKKMVTFGLKRELELVD
jgi:hypothetical protein